MTARSPLDVVSDRVLLTEPPSSGLTSASSADAPAHSWTIWRGTCHEISTGIAAMRLWRYLPPDAGQSQLRFRERGARGQVGAPHPPPPGVCTQSRSPVRSENF